MTISQLSLTDFRNLRSTTLDFDPRFNLIAGVNGSGKTSLNANAISVKFTDKELDLKL